MKGHLTKYQGKTKKITSEEQFLFCCSSKQTTAIFTSMANNYLP
jgi:hypothetical protein